MRNFLKLLVIAPLALLFLAFAMANRQNVVVSFDPFKSGDIPSPQVVLPLFLVLIVAIAFGVFFGGIATWFRQGRHRRALRDARAKAEELRGENESLRAELAAAKTAPVSANGAIVSTRGAA